MHALDQVGIICLDVEDVARAVMVHVIVLLQVTALLLARLATSLIYLRCR